jgi:tetratricopeptide (TPR) repeat protein
VIRPGDSVVHTNPKRKRGKSVAAPRWRFGLVWRPAARVVAAWHIIRSRLAIPLAFIAALAGCTHSAPTPASRSGDDTAKIEQASGIFSYVAATLNGLAEFDAVQSNPRDIFDLNEAARRALESGVPPALVSQLNQWIVLQSPLSDWRRDAMLDTLPEPLRKAPQLRNLDAMAFARADGIDLRQAIWLRDASNWSAGATQDDLERARRLFDWVVRNIQLDAPDDTDAVPRLAWQTMLLGHGGALDRAWLFILTARQQGLDVVMLARPAPEGEPQPWVCALLHEGNLYLFEPRLGLPIPGPQAKGIATLAQVAADDGLLRHLDLDDEHRYSMSADDIQKLVALVEASPMYLAQRMALLESQLAGDQSVVLSVDAQALAERLRGVKHVSEVRLWPLPYERLAEQARLGRKGRERLAADFEPFIVPFPRQSKKKLEFVPALWKGRVLHLMGQFSGERGAMRYYQLSRPSDADIERGLGFSQEDMEDLQGKFSPDEWQHAGNRYALLAPIAKHDASYWLGLVAYERGNYKTAADYFTKRTLDVNAESPWRAGAVYNLARAQEALDLTEGAVSLYRDYGSPQRHGNLLRARWLNSAGK